MASWDPSTLCPCFTDTKYVHFMPTLYSSWRFKPPGTVEQSAGLQASDLKIIPHDIFMSHNAPDSFSNRFGGFEFQQAMPKGASSGHLRIPKTCIQFPYPAK
jgi:hypothetical protein